MIDYAINFYTDFVLPKKKYTLIDNSNQDIFLDIVSFLKKIDADSSSEDIQTQIYEIGKKYNFTNLRDYFKLIYQVLFGQEQGPRLGSFIKLFGIEKTISLIEDLLKQKWIRCVQFYKVQNIILKLLRNLPPELAHMLTLKLLQYAKYVEDSLK